MSAPVSAMSAQQGATAPHPKCRLCGGKLGDQELDDVELALCGLCKARPEGGSSPPPEPTFVLLADLPRSHPLRTKPLGEVGAECRNKLSKEWRPVARWRIATCSYDDLGPSWLDTSEFRARR
jgi:hypothetical protein